MFKLLIKILRNESGISPLIVGGALAGGGSLLGGIFGKKKRKTYDPYAGLRGDWQNWLRGKLGTSTPYQYNPAFNLTQPDIEAALESSVLGRVKQGPQKMQSDIFDTMKKYQDVRTATMKSRHEGEQKDEGDMWNRLGLVSSTPGLTGMTDLRRDQNLELSGLEADVAREGIGYEMAATGLAEQIYNQYMNQANVLGQQQRGYEQYGQGMSMSNIERMVNEEMGYGQLAGNVISDNPPQSYFEPNIWSQIGQSGQDIGTMLMMSGLLSGGGNILGGGASGGATAGIGGTGGVAGSSIEELLALIGR